MADIVLTLSFLEDKTFPRKLIPKMPYSLLNLWSGTLSGVWWHWASPALPKSSHIAMYYNLVFYSPKSKEIMTLGGDSK